MARASDRIAAAGMARPTDPDTSHTAAAEAARKLRASQRRILAMFKLYGDMTDEELLTVLHEAERSASIHIMSPSGARSRRSELSKPNMDRLREIHSAMVEAGIDAGRTREALEDDESLKQAARDYLRTEGFRSELWDTGVTRVLESGKRGIVWGIAK